MLASAAMKNALDGFPMTVAFTPVAYCKHNNIKTFKYNTDYMQT